MLKRCRIPSLWQAVLCGLLLATCLRVWMGPGHSVPRARAQIPDAGLQRKEQLEETKKTNQLLARLIQLLETKTIKVRIEPAESESKGKAAE